MNEYHKGGFQKEGDWLKMIILYHFRKMTSVSFVMITAIYKK